MCAVRLLLKSFAEFCFVLSQYQSMDLYHTLHGNYQILRLSAVVSCFLVNHQLHCFFFQDVVTLQQRPPFHSTSLVLAVTGLLWLTSLVLHLPQLKKLTLACFVAWLSHHLRDAVRRGLWFPPFGSTPPLPYAVYIVATVVLSVAVHVVYSLCSFVSSDTSVGEDLEAGQLSTVLLQWICGKVNAKANCRHFSPLFIYLCCSHLMNVKAWSSIHLWKSECRSQLLTLLSPVHIRLLFSFNECESLIIHPPVKKWMPKPTVDTSLHCLYLDLQFSFNKHESHVILPPVKKWMLQPTADTFLVWVYCSHSVSVKASSSITHATLPFLCWSRIGNTLTW